MMLRSPAPGQTRLGEYGERGRGMRARTFSASNWVLALLCLMILAPFITPIPGTRRRKYLEENAGAAEVTLTADDMTRIDAAFPVDLDAGPRYPGAMMASLNG